MLYYLSAAGLIPHSYFCGLGLGCGAGPGSEWHPRRAGAPGAGCRRAPPGRGVRDPAASGAPSVAADALIAAVRGIENETDPARLLRLTVPA